jgi:hypothetical protein
MKYLILIIYSLSSHASIINTVEKKSDVQIRAPKKRNSVEMNALRKLSEQNNALLKLLQSKTNEEKPFIWDGTKKIESTKVIRGILLNSVVSTNLDSPLLVESIDESSLPAGTKFRCTGVTKNKRVLTVCDRMITPSNEVEVKVQVLNIDGTAGLRGEYNDGKDSYIAGAVISEFARGVISASKDKVILPFGSIDSDTEKNKVLEGLANSMSTTTDLITDSMKSQEPKVFIEAGKPVLIFFMEGLNGY